MNLSFTTLVRRWLWVVLLGIGMCGGMTYLISLLIPPTYEATATLFVRSDASTSSYDNTVASLEMVPTYARLVKSSEVLRRVRTLHPEMTLQQLDTAIDVQPVANTQLIMVTAESRKATMAQQLANDVASSFQRFTSTKQNSVGVRVVPAELPIAPVSPKPLLNGLVGVLAGLGLAVALIVIFEWADRLEDLPQLQKLLDMELLAVITRHLRSQHLSLLQEDPSLAEKYRLICSHLDSSQSTGSYRLLMVTSALAGEGKSIIATNVAVFLARMGKRVLLIDANVQHPTLHKYFQLDNQTGFADTLEEHWRQPVANLYGHATSIPSLQVMTAGKTPDSLAGKLSSPHVLRVIEQFKQAPFDYVIFDAPALLVEKEAAELARLSQAVLLVVDATNCSRRSLLRVKKLLQRSDATPIGAVINNSLWPEERDLLYLDAPTSSSTAIQDTLDSAASTR